MKVNCFDTVDPPSRKKFHEKGGSSGLRVPIYNYNAGGRGRLWRTPREGPEGNHTRPGGVRTSYPHPSGPGTDCLPAVVYRR